jgi:hypothetical protein
LTKRFFTVAVTFAINFCHIFAIEIDTFALARAVKSQMVCSRARRLLITGNLNCRVIIAAAMHFKSVGPRYSHLARCQFALFEYVSSEAHFRRMIDPYAML